MPQIQKKPLPNAPARASSLRCPRCGWRDVRPSHPRGYLDRLLDVMGFAAYRCRCCGARFHRGKSAHIA